MRWGLGEVEHDEVALEVVDDLVRRPGNSTGVDRAVLPKYRRTAARGWLPLSSTGRQPRRLRVGGEMSLNRHPSEFWMRPVSFAGLHRILHILAEYPHGLRSGELDSEIRQRRAYLTRSRSAPKRTTLYHCRNTLLRIGALRTREKRLTVNIGAALVVALLAQPPPREDSLTPAACDLFAQLVLSNRHCRRHFFDLFMRGNKRYAVEGFRTKGQSVTWCIERLNDSRHVSLAGVHGWPSVTLRSSSEVKSILYGVRYWARDQLRLVDEFFREGAGVVMYPILAPGLESSAREVAQEIIGLIDPSEEWTRISMRELAAHCCEGGRRPLRDLFGGLRRLGSDFPGQVVLVATSRSFAALTARSQQAEELHLRSYFRDPRGRYISHVRLHRSVQGATQCPTD